MTIPSLGYDIYNPGWGHCPAVTDLPVQAVGEVLHDDTGVILVDLEIIYGRDVGME